MDVCNPKMNCNNCNTATNTKMMCRRPFKKHALQYIKKLPKNSQAIVTLVNRKRGTSKSQTSH